ncbi:MmgE/PrpD family protein [Actinomadura mexicana]|uniref:2-methylcitrate dehydratase PrpD n=1 Tax=Actinomadura mexicana TaxID=134959 RepID=A0A238XFM1_9ACTN|nr:MmgE/PrpD family protein [Actinomadura mexicana]SNR57510.1 2-methylcitrate dehydratase PrpD [Actinomadura mexicana]
MTTGAEPSYEEIAEAVLDSASRPLPGEVAKAARRTLFNVLAVALGASGSPQVGRLATALAAPTGMPAAPGMRENASPADAALLTGFAAHLDDFDDTHLVTVIHPGASVLGAAWAAGWPAAASGRDLLTAFALGCEVQLRLGLAVSPEHYDRGWHITGTCGVVGAAVTAGLLGAPGRDRLAAALRLASLQTLGHREAFGTEVKPFHAGKAAAGGVLAAAEAARGRFTAGAAAVLPDTGGLLRALAPGGRSPGRLLDGFGTRWELADNTFKPYPCGIVAHPGIDAAVGAHDRGVAPADVVRIRYRCHPLVPELMGRLDPRTGLQARFSAVHGVAAGLARGTGGLAEFGDAAVADPVLARLRARVELCPEPRMPRDSAVLEIHTADGGTVVSAIEHARGSLQRPLTDDELIGKAEALAPGRARAIWEAVARLGEGSGPGTVQALLEETRREVVAR